MSSPSAPLPQDTKRPLFVFLQHVRLENVPGLSFVKHLNFTARLPYSNEITCIELALSLNKGSVPRDLFAVTL